MPPWRGSTPAVSLAPPACHRTISHILGFRCLDFFRRFRSESTSFGKCSEHPYFAPEKFCACHCFISMLASHICSPRRETPPARVEQVEQPSSTREMSYTTFLVRRPSERSSRVAWPSRAFSEPVASHTELGRREDVSRAALRARSGASTSSPRSELTRSVLIEPCHVRAASSQAQECQTQVTLHHI